VNRNMDKHKAAGTEADIPVFVWKGANGRWDAVMTRGVVHWSEPKHQSHG
jgi:hypothetical protein